MNGSNVIKFADGQKLNRVEETTHLGHQITQEMDVKHEIQHKMHQTLKMWFDLDTFWKTTVCSNRWKLQVYAYGRKTVRAFCFFFAYCSFVLGVGVGWGGMLTFLVLRALYIAILRDMLVRCWDLWDLLLRCMLLRCWDPWDFRTTWHVGTLLRSLGSFTTLDDV